MKLRYIISTDDHETLLRLVQGIAGSGGVTVRVEEIKEGPQANKPPDPNPGKPLPSHLNPDGAR